MLVINERNVKPLPVFQSSNIHHTGTAPVKPVRKVAGPVAGQAKKGQANRKQRMRLERRLADWSRMVNTKGYPRPGSYQ